MRHPFLNPVEVLLVRLLARSSRIGLIMVKQHGTNISWVIRDRSDPMQMPVVERCDHEDHEPPSMQLERLYHAPDAER